jgi:adenine-specific DNA-methyltransferase
LRAKLKGDAVDIGALESEVYDHLFSFFRRYYSEGDFLAKRVYKPGVYAIPYEGEEVTLHWANKDQYYIKTSEYLRDYAFRLRPDDEQKPMRVHFRLADAVEGEHGNVKAAEGKDRVFILAAAGDSGRDFIAEGRWRAGEGALSIRFEYRPATPHRLARRCSRGQDQTAGAEGPDRARGQARPGGGGRIAGRVDSETGQITSRRAAKG